MCYNNGMNSTKPELEKLAALSDLCRRYQVRELAVFGSTVRGEQRPDSDIDLLIEFEPQVRAGFLTLSRLSRELSALLHRPVDLVPKMGLKHTIKDQVLIEAEVIYASGSSLSG